jgi:RNA polymerase sigma factor (sigma-70 family)
MGSSPKESPVGRTDGSVETVPDIDRQTRFERLAHEVAAPLRRYVVRRSPAAAVDDVVADVLLVLWRRLDDVPSDDPVPWTYAVARGCLANSRRATQRQLRLVDRISRLDPPRDQPEDEEHPEVRAALAGLRELDREVVLLWAWEGLAPREIAMVTGLSANAVSIRLHKAKKHLAAALGKNQPAAGQVPDKGRRPR